jgi:hypothetical protein
LMALYNPEQSLMSFEGQQMQGSVKVFSKPL